MATRCPRATPGARPVDAKHARNRPRYIVQDRPWMLSFGFELRWDRGYRGKDARVQLGRRAIVFYVGHHPDCGCDECIPF